MRRLVQAVVSKDSRDSRENREALYYRRLTDRPKLDENGTSENCSDFVIIDETTSLLPAFDEEEFGAPPLKRARVEKSDESQSVPDGKFLAWA